MKADTTIKSRQSVALSEGVQSSVRGHFHKVGMEHFPKLRGHEAVKVIVIGFIRVGAGYGCA